MPKCGNGLHEKDYPGRCRECVRATKRRYDHSRKGRERNIRYNHSDGGRRRTRKYLASEKGQQARRRYRSSPKGKATTRAQGRRYRESGRDRERKLRTRAKDPERTKRNDWRHNRRVRDVYYNRVYVGDKTDLEIDRRLRERDDRRYYELREVENAGR